MPTNAYPNSRYAHMTAAQVLEEQTRLLAQYAAEDAERRARYEAIMGAGQR